MIIYVYSILLFIIYETWQQFALLRLIFVSCTAVDLDETPVPHCSKVSALEKHTTDPAKPAVSGKLLCVYDTERESERVTQHSAELNRMEQENSSARRAVEHTLQRAASGEWVFITHIWKFTFGLEGDLF